MHFFVRKHSGSCYRALEAVTGTVTLSQPNKGRKKTAEEMWRKGAGVLGMLSPHKPLVGALETL